MHRFQKPQHSPNTSQESLMSKLSFPVILRRLLAHESPRSCGRTRRARSPKRFSAERLETRELLAVVVPTSAVNIGGSLIDAGNAVAVDAANNVYHMGTFNGVVDFDPGPGEALLTNASAGYPHDLYIAKYEADGSLAWARSFDTNSNNFKTSWECQSALQYQPVIGASKPASGELLIFL